VANVFTGRRQRLWLLVAVMPLAAIVAFFVANRLGGNNVRTPIDGQAATSDPVASTTGTTVSVVHDYVEFANALGENEVEGSTIEATDVAEGLRRLAGALGVLGLGSPNLPVDLRVMAEHILLNPESPATAEAVRAVLIETAAAVGAERRAAAASLQQSAGAVNPNQPLTGQAATLHQFFRRTAEALEPLAGDASQHTPPAGVNITK
jgi:hypothetical protein